MQQWIESNQAPYDDLFFHDLIQEWKLSGSMFDFNDGIARMAFMYSAQVGMEVSSLDYAKKIFSRSQSFSVTEMIMI